MGPVMGRDSDDPVRGGWFESTKTRIENVLQPSFSKGRQ